MSTASFARPFQWLRRVFAFALLALPLAQTRATQVDLNGPPGSGAFGAQIVALSNGNIVVTDPNYSEGGVTNIGAVYLYNGATRALISTLKGSSMNDQVGNGPITILANGSFVVNSATWNNGAATNAGAVTLCDATAGCSGVVSPGNSLVGSTAGEFLSGVTPLPNGNYLVRDSDWDKPAPSPRANTGAVAFCSGTTGCTGEINSGNSLIGDSVDDQVGSLGVITLSNGNYVVNSPLWNAGAIGDVGAVTFCNATAGCTGVVGSANSLVGERSNERIGSSGGASNGVVALANGNYVVASAFYNPNSQTDPNPFGAVTFCNGTTGCAGTVVSNTSLTGGINRQSVGINGVTALPNGNYVVNSPNWDNGAATDAGAVTFCSGTTGCGGTINSSNSLIGTTAFDNVGNVLTSPNLVNPVTVVSDGNYVVVTPAWDNGAIADVGAITWCSGTTGCNGEVSPANSLIGTTATDRLGSFGFVRGVYPLQNGDYVVNSPFWNNPSPARTDVGAVTFCDGPTNSCANTVISTANSLIGATASDLLGLEGTTVLSNGNYVTSSRMWDDVGLANAGAITFCSGATGCTGAVSSTNSLVGSRANDFLSTSVVVLPSGNYAVASPNWDNGAAMIDAGAITFCNGGSGCTGTISPSNSLVGSSASDQLGSSGVTVLTNGNYIASSPNWNAVGATDAGAVTFCNGTTGCSGVVSASNSLVGSHASDQVGNASRLLNGDYVVSSPNWDNDLTMNAGAVTFGDGTSGTVGAITSANSVLGTVASGGPGLVFAYDAANNQLVVGRRSENIVSLFRPAASSIRVISVARSGSDVVVTFAAMAGETYRLERKLEITDAMWQTIPGVPDLTAPNDGPAKISDPGAISLGKAFYQVRLLP